MSFICIGSQNTRFSFEQPLTPVELYSTVKFGSTGQDTMLVQTCKPNENWIRVEECSRGHIHGAQTIKLSNILTAFRDTPVWSTFDFSQFAGGGQQIFDLDLDTLSLKWVAPIAIGVGCKALVFRSLTPTEALAMMACRAVMHSGFCTEDDALHWFNDLCEEKGVKTIDGAAFSKVITALASLGCLRLVAGRIYPSEKLSIVPFGRRR